MFFVVQFCGIHFVCLLPLVFVIKYNYLFIVVEGSGYEPPDHRPPAPPDHHPPGPPAPPDQQSRRMDRLDGGEDSDADSKVSGSQLVDSCL